MYGIESSLPRAEKVRRIFATFDKDGDGLLSKVQLCQDVVDPHND